MQKIEREARLSSKSLIENVPVPNKKRYNLQELTKNNVILKSSDDSDQSYSKLEIEEKDSVKEEDENQNTLREADSTRKCLPTVYTVSGNIIQSPDLKTSMSDHISKMINFKSNLKEMEFTEVRNKDIINSVSNSSMQELSKLSKKESKISYSVSNSSVDIASSSVASPKKSAIRSKPSVSSASHTLSSQ